ncbi:MAG: SurA N-terminal domain-containing protein, partial [Candidatus Eisenbacteria bacterium]
MIERSLADRPRRTGAPGLLAWGAPLLLLVLISLVARGQGVPRASGPAAGRPAAAADPVVARVDGKPIRRSELEQRQARAMAGYKQDTGLEVPAAYQSFFLRTALEEAVRERLIAADGRKRSVRVSDAAAESVLHQDPSFRPGGRFDPARFAAYRRDNPKGFAQVREEAREFLTFQRRARQLERELGLDAATLDRLVTQRSEKV